MTKFPRFHSKDAWLDSAGREWVFAGRLPEWEALDDFVGIGCFILSKDVDFPEEEDTVSIFRGVSRLGGVEEKRLRLMSLLDATNDGFKCLVLVSEV
tara:strand:+ start:89 stop:379 length:291 start_codon:yes stop_codon:yes gene_type:complete